jgi:DNA helicase-2/ATP-dependent DNA helicase PcrA
VVRAAESRRGCCSLAPGPPGGEAAKNVAPRVAAGPTRHSSTSGHLTLAVAGSRKTQGIVDACAAADRDERILILTYTAANQVELKARIARFAGDHQRVEVAGWFAFLLGSFVRPFLPFVYPGSRLRGFDFHSPPQTYTTVESRERYFNDHRSCR